MKQKKTLGVVRALDLRIQHAENFVYYKENFPIFISNYNREINKFLKDNRIEYLNLKLKPFFLFDPVKYLFNKTSHQSWLYFDKKSLEKVLKKIDIYQIQEAFFPYSSQVARMADKFNKPLIMAPWMCFNHPSTFIPPYSYGVKNTIEKTDLFIMRSEGVNNYLSRFKIPDKKKILIYHGVNTKRFYPAFKNDNEKIKILFVGVLDESKGLNDILNIFPNLIRESKKKIELIVCGSGPLKEKILEMKKTLPINFLGQVSNLDLPKIYRSADIFCGPSRDKYLFGIKWWEEGFGFVFVESMASGLPIVTTNCGAINEIVGENNFINKQGDLVALKRSLLELINDRQLRKKIGNINRDRAINMFNMEKQVTKEEKEIIDRFW